MRDMRLIRLRQRAPEKLIKVDESSLFRSSLFLVAGLDLQNPPRRPSVEHVERVASLCPTAGVFLDNLDTTTGCTKGIGASSGTVAEA